MKGDFLDEVLDDLDREESEVVVKISTAKYSKPVTTISGLQVGEKRLREISTSLKKKMAVGGTAKDSMIILQGDHSDSIVEELKELGIPKVTLLRLL